MIALLVGFSLRQRILVIGLTCLLSVVGVFAFQSIPIDAYPDVTNIQVQVLTEAAGLSPIEVERFITGSSPSGNRSFAAMIRSSTNWRAK